MLVTKLASFSLFFPFIISVNIISIESTNPGFSLECSSSIDSIVFWSSRGIGKIVEELNGDDLDKLFSKSVHLFVSSWSK